MEELDHALDRGAKIYAEIVGYGSTGDAYHITAPAPEGEGGARAMKMAIDDAGLVRMKLIILMLMVQVQIIMINSKQQRLKKVFGDHAYNIAVSSTKSMTGHLLGAAGAVEAIFSALALKESILPPTMNL